MTVVRRGALKPKESAGQTMEITPKSVVRTAMRAATVEMVVLAELAAALELAELVELVELAVLVEPGVTAATVR
jgi:hypothetical protein